MSIHKLDNLSDTHIRIGLVVALIWLAVTVRLAAHPANFTPVAAVAIFGGTLLPWRWALSLPLISMVASDLIIGLHPLIFYTWSCFTLIAWLSHKFLKHIQPLTLVSASIGASLLFYVVSNFGVWVEGRLYTHTWQGLADCYYNALPFLRGTLLGDLAFTGLLFGLYIFVYRFGFGRENLFRLSHLNVK